jgi:hypothetical protein
MQKAPSWAGLLFVSLFCLTGQAMAEGEPQAVSLSVMGAQVEKVIVQIGGRYCEYHREDVEGALRRFPAVQQVEFLNDHGTVLVRYATGGIHPATLAEAAAGAAFGMGCKAWIDRGGSESTGS